MSNFNSCDFGAITPELVLRSLLSGITAKNTCGLRIVTVDVSTLTMSAPTQCATANDLFTLFQRALVMAADGKVALRVASTTSAAGVGLGNCTNCTNSFLMEEFASSAFLQDADGKVYLNLINVTA